MPRKIDVNGQRFGRLLVIGDADRVNGRRRVECICDCGGQTIVDPRLLLNGKSRSCGCLQKETVAECARNRSTHKMSKSREYNSWCHMKSRCEDEKNAKYPSYGGRGICVCARWRFSFENFLEDMGLMPLNCNSLDRIDVNGNYEPGNCRWADPKTQSRNKRNTIIVEMGAERIPLSVACEKLGISYRSALWRVKQGRHWMPLPKPPVE